MGSQRGDDVHVKRLAQGARLLGAVQNCNLLAGGRNRSNQLVCAERTEQANLDQANLLTLCGQVVDNFLCDVADGTHGNNDALCISSAVVVEQLIVSAQLLVDLAHVLFYQSRNGIVVGVACLTMLEEDIAVLVGTAHNRTLRIEGALAECLDSIHIAHISQIVVVPDLDLLDLVRGAETVEEVQERNAALDGSKVSNRREVHNFLRVGLSQHSKTGLTTCHDVGMVAEDVQCVGSNTACRYVEYTRQQLACDFVHVRNHQEQALRSGVGGGQCAGSQRTVHRTGCTSLGLHLDNLNGGAEDVLAAGSCPLVNIVGHRAGRRDRVDTRYFGKRIGYVSRSGVTVHGFHFSCHESNILLL